MRVSTYNFLLEYIYYPSLYLYFLLYTNTGCIYEIKCSSFIFYCFSIYLFIYIFIYLFRVANFMHNINIIHRSFSPTALFPCLVDCLSFSLHCPVCFLALPISLICPFLCLLPMPTSFCLCLLPMPFSSTYAFLLRLFYLPSAYSFFVLIYL